jgi:Tfp pilus assembly protein PilX
MFEESQTYGEAVDRRARRGMALVIVIALLTICLTLFGVWAARIMDEQRRLVSLQSRLQAVRLTEAGVQRARARLADDPSYQSETWQVAAAALGGTHDGAVRIRVLPAGEAGTAKFEAVAEYPVGSVRHVQITKRIEIEKSLSRND